jgi:hypothetical protein
MSENPSAPPPVEIIPSVEGDISAIASGHAPFLYFDSAPSYGYADGVVKITLVAQRILPRKTEQPAQDFAIVAHLRMSRTAAQSLKDALENALSLGAPAVSGTRN